MTTNFKFEKKLVGTLRHPDLKMAKAYGRSLKLRNYTTDKQKVLLILVDPQLGFIEKGRDLCVPGAIEDIIRIVEWILKNMSRITRISASMDSHLPFQIFFPDWFVDENGQPLNDFTIVTLDDLRSKKVKAIFDFQYEYEKGKSMLWSEYYVTMLEQFGKKTSTGAGDFEKKNLMLWANHCMLGTPEQAIEPTLYEAIFAHAIARKSQPKFKVKGAGEVYENYSIVEGEVEYAGDKDSGIDEDFLMDLKKYDLIYIAGEASSHCVLETIYSIIRYFQNDASDILSRVRIMEDCTSPVGGFEDMATQAFKALSSVYGLKLVKSTDPIG
jgi:nicotinamidase-related amidase